MLANNNYQYSIKHHAIVYVTLAIAMVGTFYNCLSHDFVYWDDVQYVTTNEAVKGLTLQNIQTAFSNVFVGNYAPFHILSYMVDYELWGMSPSGFIFTNLLIHFLNGVLLYHLCLKLNLHRLGAALAAFVFLMHPIQVESVVWISQRKNVLSMLFFLISFHCFISIRTKSKQAVLFSSLSIIAYALALLTKIAAVILPVAMMLYDLCYNNSEQLRKKVRIYVLFATISVLLTGIAMYTQRLTQQGAPVVYYAGTGYKMVLTMITVFPNYLLNIFWPRYLSVIYGPPVKQAIDRDVIIAALLIILLIAEGVVLYRKKSPLLFWYCFFFMAFIPVLQIIPLQTVMQDRYCYFPLVGFCGFFGMLADKYVCVKPHTVAKCALITIGMVSLATLPFLSRKQAEIWQDPVTLFSETAKKGVGSRYGCYANFVDYKLIEIYTIKAGIFLEAGNNKEALHCFRKVLEIDPLHFESLLKMAFLLREAGKYNAAYQYNRKLTENYPRRFEGFYSTGQYYMATGNLIEAEEAFKKTLELNPAFMPALRDLAGIYARKNGGGQ